MGEILGVRFAEPTDSTGSEWCDVEWGSKIGLGYRVGIGRKTVIKRGIVRSNPGIKYMLVTRDRKENKWVWKDLRIATLNAEIVVSGVNSNEGRREGGSVNDGDELARGFRPEKYKRRTDKERRANVGEENGVQTAQSVSESVKEKLATCVETTSRDVEESKVDITKITISEIIPNTVLNSVNIRWNNECAYETEHPWITTMVAANKNNEHTLKILSYIETLFHLYKVYSDIHKFRTFDKCLGYPSVPIITHVLSLYTVRHGAMAAVRPLPALKRVLLSHILILAIHVSESAFDTSLIAACIAERPTRVARLAASLIGPDTHTRKM